MTIASLSRVAGKSDFFGGAALYILNQQKSGEAV